MGNGHMEPTVDKETHTRDQIIFRNLRWRAVTRQQRWRKQKHDLPFHTFHFGNISANDSGPTGLYYHRIVVFPLSNPVTNTRQVNYNQAEQVCEAVEKQ